MEPTWARPSFQRKGCGSWLSERAIQAWPVSDVTTSHRLSGENLHVSSHLPAEGRLTFFGVRGAAVENRNADPFSEHVTI